MLRHTHVMVGCAVTVAVFQPRDCATFIMSLAAGAIGSEIADIDSATSKSHKDADRIATTAVAIVLCILFMDNKMNMGICNAIRNNSSYLRILIGVFAFMGLCLYGKEKPHRTFMHSLFGMLTITAAVWIAVPVIAPYFFVGYGTHILLDLFNKKKIQLFYPKKKGICLHLCKADGITNAVLGYTATIAVGLEIICFFVL